MGESLLFPTFPPQCLRWKLVPLSLRIVSFTLLTEERPQDVSGSASSRLWSLILEPSVGCHRPLSQRLCPRHHTRLYSFSSGRYLNNPVMIKNPRPLPAGVPVSPGSACFHLCLCDTRQHKALRWRVAVRHCMLC